MIKETKKPVPRRMVSLKVLFPTALFVLVIGLFSQAVYASSPEQILALWKMDEGSGNKMNDYSGNGFYGTVYGADWQWGRIDSCLYFDGIDDKVVTKEFGDGFYEEFSFQLWFYAEIKERSECLLDAGTSIKLYKTAQGQIICGSSSDLVIVEPDEWQAGQWNHIALRTYYRQEWGGAFQIYLNGEYKDSITPGGAYFTEGFSIGSTHDYYPPLFFKGKIDEISIYNYFLDETEIQDHYRRGTHLLACWNMNEGGWGVTEMQDTSGNEHHGVLHSTQWGIGKIGVGSQYDGENDYVDFGDINSPTATDIVTISAWVKWNSMKGHRAIFTDGGVTRGIELGIYNKQLHLAVENNDSHRSLGYATYNLGLKRWFYIVAIADGSQGAMYLYVDGKLVAQNTDMTPFTDFNGTNGTTLGCAGTQSPASNENMGVLSYFHKGLIDEVKIYNRVLTEDEILEEYKRGLGLISVWDMNENGGDTIFDSTSHKYHGQLQGAEWFSDGRIGSALFFKGNKSDVFCRDINSPVFGDGVVSIEAWVTWDYFWIGGTHTIFTDGGASHGIEFGLSGGRWLTLTAATSEGVYKAKYWADNLELNKWYHLIGIVDSRQGGLYLYINGTCVGYLFRDEPFIGINGKKTSIGSAGTSSPTTGYSGPYRCNFHNGLIDQVKIYSLDLQTNGIQDIKDHYYTQCFLAEGINEDWENGYNEQWNYNANGSITYVLENGKLKITETARNNDYISDSEGGQWCSRIDHRADISSIGSGDFTLTFQTSMQVSDANQAGEAMVGLINHDNQIIACAGHTDVHTFYFPIRRAMISNQGIPYDMFEMCESGDTVNWEISRLGGIIYIKANGTTFLTHSSQDTVARVSILVNSIQDSPFVDYFTVDEIQFQAYPDML